MKLQFKTVQPRLSTDELSRFGAFLKRVAYGVAETAVDAIPELVRKFREELKSETSGVTSEETLAGAFSRSVMLDLIGAGWQVRVVKGKVKIASPREEKNAPSELKAAVRRSHQLERGDQLRELSVRDFIRKMERRQLTEKGWQSIFSLMRDGGDLASILRKVLEAGAPTEQLTMLQGVIAPYIQFVTEDGICEHTGLALRDVWRYFRHTWVNSYKQLPGRNMSFLIRDAAARNHPIIGIAALGSSVAQQRLRDVWIGWDQDTMVETISKEPSSRYARWILDSLACLIDGLYVEDLLADGSCTLEELKKPTEASIALLELRGEEAIKEHRLYPHASTHKASHSDGDTASWKKQAQTCLFRSKRCKTLAKLLRIRAVFLRSGFETGANDELKRALENKDVRKALGRLVRQVKAQHVGIDMMDIIVCGAVAPYNALLGGKLVCMLLCSPEIITLYGNRYGGQESVIASSMKGEPVVRKPQLVFLGTTSLYGVGSSQYNRVRIPCERVGGRAGDQVIYEELGNSEGYGSYHFGELTVSLGDTLLARRMGGRRVNSIFGEGVNPRMRKLREAFAVVALPADEILRHRNSRIVYGISLARNSADILLGLAPQAEYLIPQSEPSKRTEAIAAYWRERWLLGRIGRLSVLEEVAKHNVAYPVTHGGRVILPSLDSEPGEFDSD